MNYEFQAATVYVNATNMLDPNGTQKLDSIFMASFAKKIAAQVNVFLPVVDYLVVNANEYRDEARFEQDMQFEDQGIAPDTIFGPVLARAQFMANVLCAAVGILYPVMCGSVITPYTYGLNAPGSIQFLIGGQSLKTTYDTAIQSQLAYTKWTRSGSTGTCEPDNMFYISRLGTIGHADPGWNAQTYPISIPSARWSPVITPSGNITPQYFNPSDLTHTSTPDSVHTILFGYFAANWMWGEMFIDQGPSSPASGPTYFDFKPYNSGLAAGTNNQMETPLEVYGSGGQLKYFMEGTFSNLNSSIRKQAWSGTMGLTKDYYIIVNGHYVMIQTSSVLPPNGTIQAWARYDVSYTMSGSGSTSITVNIGTSVPKRTYDGVSWYHIGNELTQTQYTGANVMHSDFKGPKLSTGTSYDMGIQFYYQTQNVTAKNPGTIKLVTSYQVVYSGYYNVPI